MMGLGNMSAASGLGRLEDSLACSVVVLFLVKMYVLTRCSLLEAEDPE